MATEARFFSFFVLFFLFVCLFVCFVLFLAQMKTEFLPLMKNLDKSNLVPSRPWQNIICDVIYRVQNSAPSLTLPFDKCGKAWGRGWDEPESVQVWYKT